MKEWSMHMLKQEPQPRLGASFHTRFIIFLDRNMTTLLHLHYMTTSHRSHRTMVVVLAALVATMAVNAIVCPQHHHPTTIMTGCKAKIIAMVRPYLYASSFHER